MSQSLELRAALKRDTAALHDRLDDRLGALALDGDYAAFLATQYRARAAIETWFDGADAALPIPPQQTPLIAADLAELGHDLPGDIPSFSPDDRHEALGVAWVLAGSSLGNRTILARRRKAGERAAERFLSDAAMPRYWTTLLPLIEQPRERTILTHALKGARRAFETFLAALPDRKRVAA